MICKLLKIMVYEIQEVVSGEKPDSAFHGASSATKDHHRWNTPHSIVPCRFLVLIDIHLVEVNPSFIVAGHILKSALKYFARATPCSEEIHHYWTSALKRNTSV